MIEFIFCLVASAGVDCSFTIHLANATEYREIVGPGSWGIIYYETREIYINTASNGILDDFGMTAWDHELLHARLYLEWIIHGSPGPCWCHFHD